jgi:hypothetical protein
VKSFPVCGGVSYSNPEEYKLLAYFLFNLLGSRLGVGIAIERCVRVGDIIDLSTISYHVECSNSDERIQGAKNSRPHPYFPSRHCTAPSCRDRSHIPFWQWRTHSWRWSYSWTRTSSTRLVVWKVRQRGWRARPLLVLREGGSEGSGRGS